MGISYSYTTVGVAGPMLAYSYRCVAMHIYGYIIYAGEAGALLNTLDHEGSHRLFHPISHAAGSSSGCAARVRVV